MKGHFGKGLDESVAYDLCLHLPLPAPQEGPGGALEAHLPHWSGRHDTRSQHKLISALATPSRFCFIPKEHTTVIIAQIAMFFGNLAKRMATCLGSSVLKCHYSIAFSGRLLHVKLSGVLAIWILVPLYYVQFVPQV